MAKKKKEALTFPQIIAKLKHAGIENSDVISTRRKWDDIDPLEVRIKKVLGVVKSKKVTDMLFFIMYDIESNKVRRHVAKYLLRMGCFRVQRSIFLADISHEKYQQIRNDLTEVQAFYDNEDSILIVPVSTELIKAMKIIGKSIDIDIITHSKNTLFF